MGGVIDFIEITNRESIFYSSEFSLYSYVLFVFFLCFSGGILGWDPVHTTCIPWEMMMRW